MDKNQSFQQMEQLDTHMQKSKSRHSGSKRHKVYSKQITDLKLKCKLINFRFNTKGMIHERKLVSWTTLVFFCSMKSYKWNYVFLCVWLGSFTQDTFLRFFSMLLHLSVLKLLSGILLYDYTIVYYLACYWSFGLFSVINK